MIIINASNIASLLGRNTYSSLAEAYLAAWKSSDKVSYKTAHTRNCILTKDELIEETLRKIPDAKSRGLDRSIPRPLFVNEDEKPRPDDTKITKKHVDIARYLYNTTRGIAKEDVILSKIQDILPEYGFDKLDTLLQKQVGGAVLQGKVDGISNAGDCILEIKTRMHKLFMKPREYELYQVALYFILLERAENAFLVEAYFRSREPDLNFIEIRRHDVQDKIDEILTNITDISSILSKLISDAAIQDTFLCSSRPEMVIKKLRLTKSS